MLILHLGWNIKEFLTTGRQSKQVEGTVCVAGDASYESSYINERFLPTYNTSPQNEYICGNKTVGTLV